MWNQLMVFHHPIPAEYHNKRRYTEVVWVFVLIHDGMVLVDRVDFKNILKIIHFKNH
jgi:hypothetical protein